MKIRQISLQTPAINIESSAFTEKMFNAYENLRVIVKEKLSNALNFIGSFARSKKRTSGGGTDLHTQTNKRFKLPSLKNKKLIRSIFVVVAVLLVIFVGSKLIKNTQSEETQDNRVEVKGAVSMTEVGKEFEFPLNNSDGEEISKIKYEIERAELRDEIITEGKRATAVKGRLFLILVLKITNQYEKSIKINTRDYVRLSVNGSEGELLAPETHNDPVEIQAISTKYTRVGFIVNDTDKDFVLHVGQIKGDKERVNLDFN